MSAFELLPEWMQEALPEDVDPAVCETLLDMVRQESISSPEMQC